MQDQESEMQEMIGRFCSLHAQGWLSARTSRVGIGGGEGEEKDGAGEGSSSLSKLEIPSLKKVHIWKSFPTEASHRPAP